MRTVHVASWKMLWIIAIIFALIGAPLIHIAVTGLLEEPQHIGVLIGGVGFLLFAAIWFLPLLAAIRSQIHWKEVLNLVQEIRSWYSKGQMTVYFPKLVSVSVGHFFASIGSNGVSYQFWEEEKRADSSISLPTSVYITSKSYSIPALRLHSIVILFIPSIKKILLHPEKEKIELKVGKAFAQIYIQKDGTVQIKLESHNAYVRVSAKKHRNTLFQKTYGESRTVKIPIIEHLDEILIVHPEAAPYDPVALWKTLKLPKDTFVCANTSITIAFELVETESGKTAEEEVNVYVEGEFGGD